MRHVQTSKAIKSGILTLGLMTSVTSFTTMMEGICSQVLASEVVEKKEHFEVKEEKVELTYEPKEILTRILKIKELVELQLPKITEAKSEEKEDLMIEKNSLVGFIESYKGKKSVTDLNEILSEFRNYINGDSIQKTFIDISFKKIISTAKLYDSTVSKLLKINDINSLGKIEKIQKEENIKALSIINNLLMDINFFHKISIYLNGYSENFQKIKSEHNTKIESFETIRKDKIEELEKVKNSNENTVNTLGEKLKENEKKPEFIEELTKNKEHYFNEQSKIINEKIENLKKSETEKIEKLKENLNDLFCDYQDGYIGQGIQKLTRRWNNGTFSRSEIEIDPTILNIKKHNDDSTKFINKELKFKFDKENKEIEEFNQGEEKNKKEKVSTDLFGILGISLEKDTN